ncbi:hypothetical protein ACKAV7_001813 [Fusarium commune]
MNIPYRLGVAQDGNHPPNATQRAGLSPTRDGQYIADGGRSVQRNAPENNDQNSKKQRREKGYSDKVESSAANPWASAEIRQSAIDKALGAIFSGLPLTEIEPQVNDGSTIFSTNISDVSPYGESTFDAPDDILSSVPESFVDPYDIDQWTSPLKTAIFNIDHDKVHAILKNSFDKVAIGEYSWLLELKALGLSMDEIADELLESQKEDEAMPTVSSQPSSFEADSENPVRETVEYLCGIRGVSPMPDGSHNLQFGSVVFENANSTAIVSLLSGRPFQVVLDVLQHLEKAIGTLQQVGGCCDSFTFLARQESLVELGRIDPMSTSILEALPSRTNSETSLEDLDQRLLSSLTAQFFSLAFALYAQGHCEPFSPFFLDTSLKRILLIGNQIWGPSFTGPCILASPVELSCFGDMVQRRDFAFQYFEAFERSKVFSDSDKKFDLKA